MNFSRALRKLACKIGIHVHRVWGHCLADHETEYYYKCVFCDDGFWDYSIEYLPDEAIERRLVK